MEFNKHHQPRRRFFCKHQTDFRVFLNDHLISRFKYAGISQANITIIFIEIFIYLHCALSISYNLPNLHNREDLGITLAHSAFFQVHVSDSAIFTPIRSWPTIKLMPIFLDPSTYLIFHIIHWGILQKSSNLYFLAVGKKRSAAESWQ